MIAYGIGTHRPHGVLFFRAVGRLDAPLDEDYIASTHRPVFGDVVGHLLSFEGGVDGLLPRRLLLSGGAGLHGGVHGGGGGFCLSLRILSTNNGKY